MTPSQCRAARGLKDLSRHDLARAAGVDLSAVAALEDEGRASDQAVAAMRRAFETAGVEFIEAGTVSRIGGPGVRLAAARNEGLRPSELTSENDS